MATKLIETSLTSKREIARVTTRTDVIPMKEIPTGTVLDYSDYVIQEITNEETGEIFKSITIKTKDGQLYATRSEAFMRQFDEIMNLLKEDDSNEPVGLLITRGRAKSGNTFTSCALY